LDNPSGTGASDTVETSKYLLIHLNYYLSGGRWWFKLLGDHPAFGLGWDGVAHSEGTELAGDMEKGSLVTLERKRVSICG